jgi:antitoxin (DNA-binding transcriptional repressor) of toxin-antitoxin stability system
MKPTRVTNTKQIRQDLVGFLRSLADGQPVTVLYRSKPLVTIAAEPVEGGFQSPDAGTAAAARRSIQFLRSLGLRTTTLDPSKSIKELYDETR